MSIYLIISILLSFIASGAPLVLASVNCSFILAVIILNHKKINDGNKIDGERKISINKGNLDESIEYYKNYCEEKGIEFSAPIYWEVLTDTTGKMKYFSDEFRGKGQVELYLLMDPESSERRILEMRAAGMKIQEDTAFRIGASFRGIFIATGAGSKSDDPKDNINSFLRKCENQAHDAWSKDEYEDNREEADKVIRAVHTWILEKIKE